MSAPTSTSARRLSPREGKSVWLLGDLYTFKISGDDTGGRFSQVEIRAQAKNGPPPHIHHAEEETFYVIEGQFAFRNGEEILEAPAGSVVHVPRGVLHTYQNVSDKPGRLLVTVSPAGFERMFEELGEPAGDLEAPPPVNPLTVERLMAIAAKYNLEIPTPAG